MKISEEIKRLEEIASQEIKPPFDDGFNDGKREGESEVAKQALAIIKKHQIIIEKACNYLKECTHLTKDPKVVDCVMTFRVSLNKLKDE